MLLVSYTSINLINVETNNNYQTLWKVFVNTCNALSTKLDLISMIRYYLPVSTHTWAQMTTQWHRSIKIICQNALLFMMLRWHTIFSAIIRPEYFFLLVMIMLIVVYAYEKTFYFNWSLLNNGKQAKMRAKLNKKKPIGDWFLGLLFKQI